VIVAVNIALISVIKLIALARACRIVAMFVLTACLGTILKLTLVAEITRAAIARAVLSANACSGTIQNRVAESLAMLKKEIKKGKY
jgi:hypothetical protein